MRSVFYPKLINGPFGDPALYVRHAHHREALLFDCGDLHRLSPGCRSRISAVFISHAHIDHLIGFDSLLRGFLYSDHTLYLYGPPGIISRITHRLAGYTWNLFDDLAFTLIVREWGEGSGQEVRFEASRAFAPQPIGEFDCSGGVLHRSPHYQIRAVPLTHGDIVSLAFSLEESLHIAIHKDALEREGFLPGPWLTRFKDLWRQGVDRETRLEVPLAKGGVLHVSLAQLHNAVAHSERGMKVVYVTDVSPMAANIRAITALAAQAHLLVIEAVFTHADLERARKRNHLTARLAGEIARAAEARKMLVFHHSPRYIHCGDMLLNEARSAFSSGNRSEPAKDTTL
ncbi:MAG: MBL fold metallo-hydrolase [Desulfuromonadales bacterium]|nr:MBL fold metallo-hydrolase [Desulfuromonadales bacterium]